MPTLIVCLLKHHWEILPIVCTCFRPRERHQLNLDHGSGVWVCGYSCHSRQDVAVFGWTHPHRQDEARYSPRFQARWRQENQRWSPDWRSERSHGNIDGMASAITPYCKYDICHKRTSCAVVLKSRYSDIAFVKVTNIEMKCQNQYQLCIFRKVSK